MGFCFFPHVFHAVLYVGMSQFWPTRPEDCSHAISRSGVSHPDNARYCAFRVPSALRRGRAVQEAAGADSVTQAADELPQRRPASASDTSLADAATNPVLNPQMTQWEDHPEVTIPAWPPLSPA